MEKLPSKQVIEAVEKAPSGRVVASDVAASAGVSLQRAKRDLTSLAALARADLSVTADGDLIYEFPGSVSAALARNSAKYRAIEVLRKAWPAVFWLLRVSFGVALVASLVAIFSTIFFIQTSGSSSDDDRRRGDRGGAFGGGGGGFNMFFGPSPFDFFYYRPYGYYGYYGRYHDRSTGGPEEMGFLESCFSYIFGDGNPNAGIDEKRLSLAAQMIRENRGAVTAEQLAPFVEDAPPAPRAGEKESAYVDESYVLPIVSQLGGEPVVTDDGEIVYVFEELQTSASSTPTTASRSLPAAAAREATGLKRAGMSPRASSREIVQVLNYNGIGTRGDVEKSELIDLLEGALPPPTPQEEEELLDLDPTVVQEREWRFSLAPDINKVLAGGLGAVNLGGALWLGTLLARYAEYGVRLPSYFGTVQAFYPFLLAYAVLFNVIPLGRNLWIKAQNERIRQRNKRRKDWKAALERAVYGNDRIAQKLKAATKLKSNVRQIGSDKKEIVFDTSESIEKTQSRKQKQELDDFDKLLGKDDNAFQ